MTTVATAFHNMPPHIEVPEPSLKPQSSSQRVSRSELLIQTKWRCTVKDVLPARFLGSDLSRTILHLIADIANDFGRNEAERAISEATQTRPDSAILTSHDIKTAQKLLKRRIGSQGEDRGSEGEGPLAKKRKRDQDRGRDRSGISQEPVSKRQRGITKVKALGSNLKTFRPKWKGYVTIDEDTGQVVPSETYFGLDQLGPVGESDELGIDSPPSELDKSKTMNIQRDPFLPTDFNDPDETDVSADPG